MLIHVSLQHTVHHRKGYSVVRLEGEPTLDEFLAFIESTGVASRTWAPGRVLFDLRSVRTIRSADEHRRVGEAVATHLGHLERLASVVPADRLTRGSEKAARDAGANLSVYTSEGEAITWLLGG